MEVEDVFLTKFFSEYRCGWPSLRTLVLRLPGRQTEGAKEALELLNAIPKDLSLTAVTLKWELAYEIRGLRHDLLRNGVGTGNGTYEKLEHALLAFSEPRIVYTLARPLSANNSAFWLRELGKHLPGLYQRGAVTLLSRCKDLEDGEFRHTFAPRIKLIAPQVVPPVGHDDSVWALAVSPDSKWVASGSDDSTIILWDASDGTIAQQWVAHGYKWVRTLAFSPDSQYLVSGGYDDTATIWDLSRGAREVAVLEGHTKAVWACAWSPDGKTIATGSSDGTTRLWDACTFRQRALHGLTGEINRLAFSPDGRWLACVSHKRECFILNVALGTLHKSLWSYPSGKADPCAPRPVLPYAVVSAAFHPGSIRLACTSYGRGPRIDVIDVETGSTLLLGEGDGEEFAKDISFSPDGRLVLGVVGDTCYIWDASTGIKLFQLKGHKEDVATAKFSPCGRYVASASRDETVRLWKTSDRSCLATLVEHRGSRKT